MTNLILGAWSLEKVDSIDSTGKISYPLGLNPKGLLIYAETRMSGSAKLSEELLNNKQKNSLETFAFYSGPYEVSGDEIIHYVEFSNQKLWIGKELKRRYKLIDQNHLEITAIEELPNKDEYTMVYYWTKCK